MPVTELGPEGRPPGVGDIVLFHRSGDSRLLAAIVTDIHDPGQPEGRVDLTIFKPDGLEYRRAVRHSEEPTAEGCWRRRPG